jgi:hypothetical protein
VPFHLANTDLYNAGLSAGGYAIDVLNDNDAGPALDLVNVVIYSPQRKAIRMWNHKGFTAQSRVRVNNFAPEYASKPEYYANYAVLHMNILGAATLQGDVFTVGDLPTPARYVDLDAAGTINLSKDIQLHKLQKGLAWHPSGGMSTTSEDPNTPQTMTLDPGVVVAMPNSGPVTIGAPFGNAVKGTLVAVGTEAEPILFTSDAPLRNEPAKPGDWPGLYFYAHNTGPGTKIDHAILEYGGGGTPSGVFSCPDKSNATAFTGMVTFGPPGEANDFPGFPITNTVFRNGAGNAIRGNCGTGGHLTGSYDDPAFKNTFDGFKDPEKPALTDCTKCN